MVRKIELIEQRIDLLEEFAHANNLPFHHKIPEMRRDYTTSMITSVIQRFIVPAYVDKVLQPYLESELERVKLMAVTSGESADLLKFRLNSEQWTVIIEHLTYIIKVILL